jgi:hypothetical protein
MSMGFIPGVGEAWIGPYGNELFQIAVPASGDDLDLDTSQKRRLSQTEE